LIDATDSNAAYYYHFDGLGSVVALSDVNNVPVERYAYDVFGRPTIRDVNGVEIDESAIANPYLFTGRAWDPETALYYYRARYYDYFTGRFLQPDQIGYADGLNLYAYVGNNPLNWSDASGLCKNEPSFPPNKFFPGQQPTPGPLPPTGSSPDIDDVFGLPSIPPNKFFPGQQPIPGHVPFIPNYPKETPETTREIQEMIDKLRDEGIGEIPGVKEQQPKGPLEALLKALAEGVHGTMGGNLSVTLIIVPREIAVPVVESFGVSTGEYRARDRRRLSDG
jgi:RHS repeat-associated protein